MSTPTPTCPNCLSRAGFSLLDELCSSCFSELIIQPAMEASDFAIASWADAVDRRYRVECALGLRAAPEQNEEREASSSKRPAKIKPVKEPLSDDDFE